MTEPDALMTPAQWMTLLIVGLPGTLFGVVALARGVLNEARAKASLDGAKDQMLREVEKKLNAADGIGDEAIKLRSEVDALHDVARATADSLQKHLIDCAKSHGKVETLLVGLAEGQDKQGRAIEGLQRTVANWMRDAEKSAP